MGGILGKLYANRRELGILGPQALRSLAEGSTFGWSQEAYAALDAALGRGKYSDLLRQNEQLDAQTSPWVRVPGNIVGGGLSLGALGAAGLPLLGPASWATFPRYALPAAIQSAVMGAGTSRPGERAKGAAISGGIGGVLGGASGVLGVAARNQFGRVFDDPSPARIRGLMKAQLESGHAPGLRFAIDQNGKMAVGSAYDVIHNDLLPVGSGKAVAYGMIEGYPETGFFYSAMRPGAGEYHVPILEKAGIPFSGTGGYPINGQAI